MDRHETVGSHCWIGHEVIHDMFVRHSVQPAQEQAFWQPTAASISEWRRNSLMEAAERTVLYIVKRLVSG